MSKTDEKIYLNGVRKRISWIIDSLIPTDDHQNIHTYFLARVFLSSFLSDFIFKREKNSQMRIKFE